VAQGEATGTLPDLRSLVGTGKGCVPKLTALPIPIVDSTIVLHLRPAARAQKTAGPHQTSAHLQLALGNGLDLVGLQRPVVDPHVVDFAFVRITDPE
jgi:hypothetical protein